MWARGDGPRAQVDMLSLGRVTVHPEQCGRQGIEAGRIRSDNCVASLSLHGCYCKVEER